MCGIKGYSTKKLDLFKQENKANYLRLLVSFVQHSLNSVGDFYISNKDPIIISNI